MDGCGALNTGPKVIAGVEVEIIHGEQAVPVVSLQPASFFAQHVRWILQLAAGSNSKAESLFEYHEDERIQWECALRGWREDQVIVGKCTEKNLSGVIAVGHCKRSVMMALAIAIIIHKGSGEFEGLYKKIQNYGDMADFYTIVQNAFLECRAWLPLASMPHPQVHPLAPRASPQAPKTDRRGAPAARGADRHGPVDGRRVERRAPAEARAVAPTLGPVLPGRLALQDSAAFDNALWSKEDWARYIAGPAHVLKAQMAAEYKASKRWIFHCAICERGQDGSLAVEAHLTSKGHFSALWRSFGQCGEWESPPWSTVCGRSTSWVQNFDCSTGVFWFNHATGESGLESSAALRLQNGTAEAALQMCSWLGISPTPPGLPHWPCPAELGGAPQHREQAHPGQGVPELLRKFAFAGELALPSNDFVSDDAIEWEHAIPEHAHLWGVPMPCGNYTVLMGFYTMAGVPLEGHVNGMMFNETASPHASREHRIDISHNGGYLIVGGKCVQRLSFVQVWALGAKGVPALPLYANDYFVKAPRFDEAARGKASDWNVQEVDGEEILAWGKRTLPALRELNLPTAVAADINSMVTFLKLRGVADLLGPPVRQGDGWYSMTVRNFTRRKEAELEADGWARAWHGCKIESLYSIIENNKIFASRDEEAGERTIQNSPGVYVYKDAVAYKAEPYTHFVNLNSDGVLWGCKWELRVDREQRVSIKHKDMWCQREEGIRLAALWLCGRTEAEMDSRVCVSRRWRPEVEAHPGLTKQARGTGTEALPLALALPPPPPPPVDPPSTSFATISAHASALGVPPPPRVSLAFAGVGLAGALAQPELPPPATRLARIGAGPAGPPARPELVPPTQAPPPPPGTPPPLDFPSPETCPPTGLAGLTGTGPPETSLARIAPGPPGASAADSAGSSADAGGSACFGASATHPAGAGTAGAEEGSPSTAHVLMRAMSLFRRR